MTNTLKVTEVSAAVRGYHYYDSIWFPEKEEQLDCSHNFGNVFDAFTIKTCKPDGTVVGHLPRGISRASNQVLAGSRCANFGYTNINRLPKVSFSPRWFGESM